MKLLKLSSAMIMICFALQLSAQKEGVIRYTETMKLAAAQMDDLSPAEAAAFKKMPETITQKSVIRFNQQGFTFEDDENQEKLPDMLGFDEAFEGQVNIIQGDESNAYYVDLKQKYFVEKTNILGKKFIIKDTIEQHKWTITQEKIKYLGYVCQKATATNCGQEITAWFAPDLPHGVGPKEYSGLPGTILMMKMDDEFEIAATEVKFEKVAKLDIPNTSKTVTEAEFAEIFATKMEELEAMYQTKGKVKVIKTK